MKPSNAPRSRPAHHRLATILVLLASLAASSAARAADTLFPEGRSLPRDLGRGVGLLFDDAWAALTFPAHLGPRDQDRVLAVVGVGFALFCFDEPLYDLVQRIEDDPPFQTVREVGDELDAVGLMGETWPFYAGAIGLGYALDETWLLRIGGEILEAQLISGGLRSISQKLIGRRRPNEGLGAYHFELDGGTSIPSGHASSFFALIEVLAHHAQRRWVTVGLYGLGGAVMLQRVTSGQHWPSDAWIGAAAGFGAARLVTRRHDRLLGVDHGRGGVSIEPALLPGGEPGVALRAGF